MPGYFFTSSYSVKLNRYRRLFGRSSKLSLTLTQWILMQFAAIDIVI